MNYMTFPGCPGEESQILGGDQKFALFLQFTTSPSKVILLLLSPQACRTQSYCQSPEFL